MNRSNLRNLICGVAIFSGVIASLNSTASAQRVPRAATPGAGTVSNVDWHSDGKSVAFTTEGQRFRFDLETKVRSAIEPGENKSPAPAPQSRRGPTRRGSITENGNTGKYLGQPGRGRQYTNVESPDGKWEAQYQDWNLLLVDQASKEVVNVTTDGNENIHYGTASWVYGEELDQNKAMWWTPDSKKILYYKFDDTNVEKFYLVRGWSEINTKLYPEYYAKAGAPNPIAELFIYDLQSKVSKRVEIGGSGDEYIYGIRVSPQGDVMLVNWTDRLQQQLKVQTIDLESGKCTTIIEENQDTWQSNSPPMTFLKDQQRFLALFLERHRGDGSIVTFLIRPDEARVRRHFDVPTEECHGI